MVTDFGLNRSRQVFFVHATDFREVVPSDRFQEFLRSEDTFEQLGSVFAVSEEDISLISENTSEYLVG